MNNEEKKKVIAEQKFGMPLEFLDASQLAELEAEFMSGIYDDYDSKEELLDAQYALGMDLISQPEAQMLGNGRTQFANWGGSLGNIAKAGAGAYTMNKVGDKKDALSKQKSEALALAGQVARDDTASAQTREDAWRKDILSAMAGTQKGQQPTPQGALQAPPQGAPQGPPPAVGTPQNTQGVMRGEQPAPPQPQAKPAFPMDAEGMYKMAMSGEYMPQQQTPMTEVPRGGGRMEEERRRRQRMLAAQMRGGQ